MSKRTFENKIVKLLPSNDLKEAVRLTGFRFTEMDLLKFIDEYSRTYFEKILLFEEACNVFENEDDKAHAKLLLRYYNKMYNDFMTPTDDTVYHIEIKCNSGYDDSHYITKAFDDAITLIKQYLTHYKNIGERDNEKSLYLIEKVSAIAPKKPSDFYNKIGALGKCVLGHKLKILSVDMYNVCDEFANEKERQKYVSVNEHEPICPPFLKKFDLVAFKTDYGNKTEYGILENEMDDKYGVACVLHLDNEYIKNRTAQTRSEEGYYCIYNDHSHPYYAELFKPNLNEIDKEVYSDYLYAVEELKKIESVKD